MLVASASAVHSWGRKTGNILGRYAQDGQYQKGLPEVSRVASECHQQHTGVAQRQSRVMTDAVSKPAPGPVLALYALKVGHRAVTPRSASSELVRSQHNAPTNKTIDPVSRLPCWQQRALIREDAFQRVPGAECCQHPFSGRSAAVARLLWEQDVGSSILPAPTNYTPAQCANT